MIGMGGSSRPKDISEEITPAECIDYFLGYFEKWRIALPTHYKPLRNKELTGFYIIGHSLGGYLSMHYSLRFGQHVK